MAAIPLDSVVEKVQAEDAVAIRGSSGGILALRFQNGVNRAEMTAR